VLLDGRGPAQRRLSQLELGSDLGVGARQVRRYLDELELAGLVIRTRGGRGNCALYELVPSPVIGEVSSRDDRTSTTALERTSHEDHSEAMSAHNPLERSDINGHLTGHLTGHPRAGAFPAVEVQEQYNPPPVVPLPVDRESTTQGVVAWFVDSWREAGLSGPSKRFIGQSAREIKTLLESGFTTEDVQGGLLRMVERGVMQPRLLDGFVMEAQARSRKVSGNVDKPAARRYGRGMTAGEVLRSVHP
jgi:biotin operon repressor